MIMTRYLLQLATIAVTITCVSPTLACDYPAKIGIPSGLTAEKEEMLAAQRQVKQYVADMEAYLDCIVAEEKMARQDMVDLAPEDEQQREEMLNKKYNAAVEEMERVAAEFNAEVQAYRDKSK